MQKAVCVICLSVAVVAVGFWVEPLFPLGDWRWGLVAVLAMTPAAIAYRREIYGYISRQFTLCQWGHRLRWYQRRKWGKMLFNDPWNAYAAANLSLVSGVEGADNIYRGSYGQSFVLEEGARPETPYMFAPAYAMCAVLAKNGRYKEVSELLEEIGFREVTYNRSEASDRENYEFFVKPGGFDAFKEWNEQRKRQNIEEAVNRYGLQGNP